MPLSGDLPHHRFVVKGDHEGAWNGGGAFPELLKGRERHLGINNPMRIIHQAGASFLPWIFPGR